MYFTQFSFHEFDLGWYKYEGTSIKVYLHTLRLSPVIGQRYK